jgi:hypothetical protein
MHECTRSVSTRYLAVAGFMTRWELLISTSFWGLTPYWFDSKPSTATSLFSKARVASKEERITGKTQHLDNYKGGNHQLLGDQSFREYVGVSTSETRIDRIVGGIFGTIPPDRFRASDIET